MSTLLLKFFFIWSFSVLLFEIFSLGDSPYQEIKPQEMISYLEQGNRLPQPKQCPNEMWI
uniref:Pkinase_Tyr domain-containing protein n=1 Tax=Heterorhabditis bacteriophora TaxID=37862 RepID=A0A1I7WM56_HETBA